MADDLNADDTANGQTTGDQQNTDQSADQQTDQQTGDQSTDQNTDGQGNDQSGDAEAGAPENYDDFTLPEGMELNSELLEQAAPVFKDLGLNQEQAQKLVDFEAQRIQSEMETATESWNKQLTDWEADIKNDPEFGGDKFDENLGIAKLALEKFGDDKLVEDLNRLGFGSNPGLIRLLCRAGAGLKEDNPGAGGDKSAGGSLLNRLYADDKPQS